MGARATRRAVGQALVEVCRGRIPTPPAGAAAVADLVAGARFHRIAPLVHVRLREAHPGPAALLKPDRDEALLHHLRATTLLAGVAGRLDGLDWLAFKGPMLSEFAHPVPGLRFYKDLDVLVAPGDFATACHRLIDAGWRPLLSEESLLSSEFPGELPMGNQAGIVLDLHWAMMVMRTQRRRFRCDAASLLERRRSVTIGPARLWALSPADALVHVCLHAALIGATRLGHILDCDQLARQVDDWEAVVDRAGRWGAGVEVACVLGRAQRLLDSPAPPGLGRRLGVTGPMAGTMRLVDLAFPIPPLRRDESWARMLTRSFDRGVPGTLGRAGHRLALGVWHRLRRGPRADVGVSTSPAVLEQFLRKVAATAG